MAQRARARAGVTAGVLVLLFVAIAVLSTRTAPGTTLDNWLRDVVTNGLPPEMRESLDELARPRIMVILAPVVVVLTLLAGVRTRWRQASAAVLVVTVAPLLAFAVRSQELIGAPGGAFPSNHTTVGLALLVGVVLAWPVRVVGWGLFAAAVVAICILVGNVSWYAHAPRDVVGSLVLVAAVTAAVLALFGSDIANVRVSEPASSLSR